MTNYANRGMAFEALINLTNEMYIKQNRAIVHKRPTPIKVIKQRAGRINHAVFEAPSTVDYSGCYQGRSLQFEAKSTKIETRFDLSNIHEHQIEHMRSCIQHGAVVFVLIEFASLHEVYYMPGFMMVDAWDKHLAGGRGSIPYNVISDACYLVKAGKVPLDYLTVVDRILVKTQERKNEKC